MLPTWKAVADALRCKGYSCTPGSAPPNEGVGTAYLVISGCERGRRDGGTSPGGWRHGRLPPVARLIERGAVLGSGRRETPESGSPAASPGLPTAAVPSTSIPRLACIRCSPASTAIAPRPIRAEAADRGIGKNPSAESTAFSTSSHERRTALRARSSPRVNGAEPAISRRSSRSEYRRSTRSARRTDGQRLINQWKGSASQFRTSRNVTIPRRDSSADSHTDRR